MLRSRLLAVLICFVTDSGAALRAQLVHLALEAPVSFEASLPGATFTLPDNSIVQLDVFYETNLIRQNPDDSLAEFGGVYISTADPNRANELRIRVADLSFYRPMTSLVVRPDRLAFEYADEGGREFVSAEISFSAPIAPHYALPVPPFPNLTPGFQPSTPLFFGGPNMFGGLDDPNEANWGYLNIGSYTSFTAEVMPALTPVPEPSTWAVTAALGLVLLGWYRARRSSEVG